MRARLPNEREDLPGIDGPEPPSRWVVWLRRGVAALLALTLLVALFAWWAIGSASGRRWILGQVESRTLAASGWQLDIKDFRLGRHDAVPADVDDADDVGRSAGPRLDIEGIRVGAPGAPPLVAVERALVDFRWGVLASILWGDSFVLERTELRGVTVDSAAPLPEPSAATDPTSDSASDQARLPLSIPEVVVRRGLVLGGPTEGWLETWSVRDLGVRGALGSDGFHAQVDGALLRLSRRDAPDLDLELTGRARGPFVGPWALEQLDVRGDGLDVQGSATAGVGADEPLEADFFLSADAERLLASGVATPALPPHLDPSTAADGTLRASGQIDFRRLAGSLQVEADGFPAEFFEPFVGSRVLDAAAARGTRLDAKADLVLGGDPPAPDPAGRADLVWRNDIETLLRASLETQTATGQGPPPLRLAISAEILPDMRGRRHVEGTIQAPSWARIGEARTERTRLLLDVGDLAALRRELLARWPQSLDALPELPWNGALRADLGLRGALDDPSATLRATWRPAGPGAGGGSLQVDAEGRPMRRRLTGAIQAQRFDLDSLTPLLATSPTTGIVDGTVRVAWDETLRIEADAGVTDLRVPSGEPLQAPTLDASSLRASTLRASTLRAEGEVTLPGVDLASARTDDLVADLRIVAEGLEPAAGPRFDRLDLDLRFEQAHLRLRRGEASVRAPLDEPDEKSEPTRTETTIVSSTGDPAPADPEAEVQAPRRFGEAFPVTVAGSVETIPAAPLLAPRITRADLRLSAERPHPTVDHLELDVELVEGAVGVALVGLELPPGAPRVESLTAWLPLGSLADVPGLEDALLALPVDQRADGPIRLAFDLPRVDTAEAAGWLGVEPKPTEALRGAIRGGLQLDVAAPTQSTGSIELRDVEIELTENTFRSAEVQRIEISDGRIDLRRALWQAQSRFFDAEGQVELTPGWRFGDPGADLVSFFSAVATGSLEASLLNGYLAGGRADGLAEITVLAAGTPDDYEAEIEIVGDDDMSFAWVAPYATALEAPRASLTVKDGVITLTEAEARFNEGRLDVYGEIVPGGDTRLQGFLDRIRYRLDYGLTVLVSGNFDFAWPGSGPPTLGANLLVERGFLRRQLDPDRELLAFLLEPPELDADDASDDVLRMGLDIDIATVEGVRIKNNVADLHASWVPIEVGGTLARPRIRGSVEADPGGKVYAWGQVLRLDRAVIEFSGDPDVPARLDLTTTSSLEDPSIATSDDQRLLRELSEPAPLGSSDDEDRRATREALATGLTTYYGDQLVSRLGQSLLGTRVEYRPLLLFGESSPEAKLVISQDLSSHIGLAVAFDLREADERIYMLDFRDFSFAPSFSATTFTNEENDYGATLQQVFRFGGGDNLNLDDLPRLDDVFVVCPACEKGGRRADDLSPRRIRAAVGYRPDDLIPDGTDFDVEIDVSEMLRRRGFPDPEVEVDVEPDADRGYVDIHVTVEPGPKTTFRWTGGEPPRARRDSIRSLYRVDYYEETSIDEIRDATVRVWQSLGYPRPQVEVIAERTDPDDPRSDRTVTIRSTPGDALDLEAVRFVTRSGQAETKLDERSTQALEDRFRTTLWRVQLAAREEGAGRRLLRALDALGYPGARIEDVTTTDDDRVLEVAVDPGPRRRIGSVRVEGVDAEETARALTAAAEVGLEQGAPFVASTLATAALAVESDLRQRGFYQARVHTEVSDPNDSTQDVALVLEPGDGYMLGEVAFRGLQATNEDWLRDLLDLELGKPLDRRRVTEARRKLVETSLFSRVSVETRQDEDGTVLTFEVVERTRYEVGYGIRWESEGGGGAIVDLLDGNFLGRGIDLGLRALYAESEERARLYSRFPSLFQREVGRGIDLELYAEGFDDQRGDLAERGWEASGQLSIPLLDLRDKPLGGKLEARIYGRFVDQVLRDQTIRSAKPERERTPTVGFQLVWDSRDQPLDPTRGALASVDFSGARDFLAEDDEYLRLFAQVNTFVPLRRTLDGRRWIWSQSLRFGSADTDTELPRSVRFFAGGPFSVRGYADRSLGPMEPNEDGTERARGGQALAIVNQELRFPLPWEILQGVVFVDAGNVWGDSDDLDLDDLLVSAGLGIRGQTPFGLLRLDIAFPVDGRIREEDGMMIDDDYEIYFGFGHSF